MADISNKTLALLMVGAIVVSLGGLFVSLDRLSRIQTGGVFLPGTGAAIAVGKTNVTIASSAGISLQDTFINFGECNTPAVGVANLSSNQTTGDGGYCTGETFPDFIWLRNDGNNNLNITVKTDKSARSFLGTSSSNGSSFYFTTRNGTEAIGTTGAAGGCRTNVAHCDTQDCCSRSLMTNCTLEMGWKNISAAEFKEQKACMNLTYGGALENNITLYVRIDLPSDLVGGGAERNATINFTSYVLT